MANNASISAGPQQVFFFLVGYDTLTKNMDCVDVLAFDDVIVISAERQGPAQLQKSWKC